MAKKPNRRSRTMKPTLERFTKRPMTPFRFLTCLGSMRVSQRGLAPILGCSDRLPREWASGKISVPPEVAVWLEGCLRHHKKHPEPRPPIRWRRPPGRRKVDEPQP